MPNSGLAANEAEISMSTDAADCRTYANPARFTTVLRDRLCALQFHADVQASARAASLAAVHVGGIDVLRHVGFGVQGGNRGPGDIRSDRADYYVLCMPLAAQLHSRQNGAVTSLQPGQFIFLSTTRPFESVIRALTNDRLFTAMYVRVPGSLMRPRIPNIDDICNLPLDIRPGSGRAMRTLFEIALSDGAYLSEAARCGFGHTLLDAINEVVLPVSVGAAKEIDRCPGQRRTLCRAKAYIAERLSDPKLNSCDVAGHCSVSVRYLQATFAAQASITVAGFIRETRLQQCRAALRSPLLANRSVMQIAGDWGFDDASHFSHAYRKRFGVTPREDRRSLQ